MKYKNLEFAKTMRYIIQRVQASFNNGCGDGCYYIRKLNYPANISYAISKGFYILIENNGFDKAYFLKMEENKEDMFKMGWVRENGVRDDVFFWKYYLK